MTEDEPRGTWDLQEDRTVDRAEKRNANCISRKLLEKCFSSEKYLSSFSCAMKERKQVVQWSCGNGVKPFLMATNFSFWRPNKPRRRTQNNSCMYDLEIQNVGKAPTHTFSNGFFSV